MAVRPIRVSTAIRRATSGASSRQRSTGQETSPYSKAKDWREGSELVLSYYAKHVGCRIADLGYRVPEPLRAFLDGQGEPSGFAFNFEVSGKLAGINAILKENPTPQGTAGNLMLGDVNGDGDPGRPSPDRARQLDQLPRASGLLGVANRLSTLLDQPDRTRRRAAQGRTGGARGTPPGFPTGTASGNLVLRS